MNAVSQLNALKAVDFSWVMLLESVWKEPAFHVPDLNKDLRARLLDEIDRMTQTPDAPSPLGRILVGVGGAGKTHALAATRRAVQERDGGFILIDLTDVGDFWETVLLGYLSSLQQPYRDGRTQVELILERIIGMLYPSENARLILDRFPKNGDKLQRNMDKIMEGLVRRHRARIHQHGDALRALFLFHSPDIRLSNIGYSWLQGIPLEDADRREFRFRAHARPPMEIVKGLSWLLSLRGPTLLALDQLDAIVEQHHVLSSVRRDGDLADEQLASLSIIEGIAGGLSGLVRGVAQRSLVVATCIESTWTILRGKALKSDTDSFAAPLTLEPVIQADTARRLIENRLRQGFDRIGFTPPYPSWPFRPEAFALAETASMSPRDILQLCDHHLRGCLRKKEVLEVFDFALAEQKETLSSPPSPNHGLDQLLDALRAEAPVDPLIDERNEDALAPLIQTACRCLIRERPPTGEVDPVVDVEFGGGRNYPPLHARIRLIHRDQNDLEKHYCLRAVQKHHPIAFQTRVKAAVTASGIDRKLRFRHLILIRTTSPPSGRKSKEIVEKFHGAGGRFVKPRLPELATLWALHRLENEAPADFDEWLQSRQPVSHLEMMAEAGLVKSDNRPPPSPGSGKKRPASAPSGRRPTSAPAKPKGADGAMFLGMTVAGNRLAGPVAVDPSLLARHVVVLAGSGSGKTVLLRRLVEEAALMGIPSILIDGANDLARMGDPWPERPGAWSETDTTKAGRYHRDVETVIWTPGREKGRPLTLEPLPDLGAVADDPDELEQAVAMAIDAFREIAAPGNSLTARKKIGILSSALHHFAKGPGRGLDAFVEFLSELPREASGKIRDAAKTAREIADSIRAAVQTNPLLRQRGAAMDPGLLFGEGNAKTRISVINFVGLPQPVNQQLFLNGLAMTLFSWVKKHPAVKDRPIRGLFVLDEAKDFVPSVRSAPCKSSLLRLTAQARKYGLGLIFATQSPKDLDHSVITNCATHYYGKANSPNAIKVVSDQLSLRGGDGSEVATLDKGRFYLYTETLEAPVKIQMPLCLSHHPANPLNEAEVLARAGRSLD